MTSYSGKLPEDLPAGTVVALISVQDKDYGKNGQVILNINENIPFSIKLYLGNYYVLVAGQHLDWDKYTKYYITLTATDVVLFTLSSKRSITLEVTHINDNKLAFSQCVDIAEIMKNNSPGVTLLQIHASNLDQGPNAWIWDFLFDCEFYGCPVPSFPLMQKWASFSVYEHSTMSKLRSTKYKAQDGGSPPLTINWFYGGWNVQPP